MASAKNVFLIGPGLIGADLIELLLEDGYSVTTLVRREEHAQQIKQVYPAVKVITGTLDDFDLIREHTASHPITIHAATADHLPSVEAVLAGVRDRANQGLESIYIHTSGTSCLVDNSRGMYISDKVYSDTHPEEIDTIPDDAPHRAIDLAILAARKELGTKAKVIIIFPTLVYGVGKHIKRLSIQLPTMTRFALKHGFAPIIGKGQSLRCNIHVQDLVRAYMVILHWMEASSGEEVLENPYFFCENGEEMLWRDAAVEIGKQLYQAGRIKDPEPRNVPPELYSDLFGPYSPTTVGANSRSRGDRLRGMGWKAREKNVLASFREDELPLLLAETGQFSGYAGVASSGTHVLKSLE
jgi:nucleoside-diphosphate-sugar epimerase